MPISLLGVTELSADDGAVVHVGGTRRRAVLATLALEINGIVAVDRLLDIVWDGRPPGQARAALQGHMAVLRRLLPPGHGVETHDDGYRLVGDPASVDALRFTSLVALAMRTADDRTAIRLLEDALGLWRGDAFADLSVLAFFGTASGRLADERWRAVDAWAQRHLRLGQGDAAIPSLNAALHDNTMRESLISTLMQCLHQVGRPAEALTVFQHARERLSAELGVRPGRSLQAALDQVLNGSEAHPPTPSRSSGGVVTGAQWRVPGQLPRPQFGFVGREAQLRKLDALYDAGTRLMIVCGAAGVGKTALSVRWAHHAAERFPDGQLYADLRGLAPDGPVDPADVLARFLRDLGLDEAGIPSDTESAAALFRSESRDRRLLIVLDDARDADQVRPLLPGGPGCAVVVTSRYALVDLAVDRAAALHALRPLSGRESLALLELMVGPERLDEHAYEAVRLVELCDRLPLALRLAASSLAVNPTWSVRDLIGEQGDEREFLERLDRGRAFGVFAALDLTRRQLSPTAARLLALLGLNPGTGIDAYAAAALLGSGAEPASQALMNLSAWNLVVDSLPGRYSWPGLVGMYARRVLAEISASETRSAFVRLARYLVHAAASASAMTGRVGGPGGENVASFDGPLPRWLTAGEAMEWLDVHDQVIHRMANEAARLGLTDEERALRAMTWHQVA